MSETIDENAATPTLERAGRNRSSSRRRSSPGLNSRPGLARSPASNPNVSNLPPLITAAVNRRTSSSRIPSYASKRLSTFSNASGHLPRSHPGSRPGSIVFPVFHSSLSYALVRDFAYEPGHMLHYGPPPEPLSATSASVSEFPRRLSDPPVIRSQSGRTPWSGHPESLDADLFTGPQLPATSYSDGPPWREDDDLLSPIVSTRHRKARSDIDYFSSRDKGSEPSSRRASYAGTNQDGTHNYYVEHLNENDPGEPGGEIIAYPNQHHQRYDRAHVYSSRNGAYLKHDEVYDDDDDSRFSRDYSFSIASPDEEMHGKAIALFDFEAENDNELPLKEGQVLWVSYRHGEGWLVAKDPSTGEDGLVPESYVRLERDIPGGFGSLNGQIMGESASPIGPDTPVAAPGLDSSDTHPHAQYPMVSHFTTSSKDLLPHDKHTHTPISSSASPSKQLDAQLEAATGSDRKGVPSGPDVVSESDETETDEDEPPETPRSHPTNMHAVIRG